MKVAMIGTVPASRIVAPYDDTGWEIWGCSPGNRGQLPRVTRWFELHSLVDMAGAENNAWRPDYYAWLSKQPFPLYMQEKSPMFPQAIVYPRDAMIKKFGRRWFTSSLAWMMALAIDEMDKRPGERHSIGIFGVDMAADQEYHTQQKAGCTRFIEIAEERGIEVFVPLESCLAVPPPLYGYAEGSRMGRKLLTREFELQETIQQMDAQMIGLRDQLCFMRGAMANNSYVRRTFVDGMDCILDVANVQQQALKSPMVNLTTQTSSQAAAQRASADTGEAPPVVRAPEGLEGMHDLPRTIPDGTLKNGKAGDVHVPIPERERVVPRRVDPQPSPGGV